MVQSDHLDYAVRVGDARIDWRRRCEIGEPDQADAVVLANTLVIRGIRET
jgi:hypothetical protein